MRKGQADIALNWAIIRIPILMIIASTLIIIITSSLMAKVSTHEIENILLINRLLNSPNLLAYKDTATGRVYPGTIDMDKFNTQHLEQTLLSENKRIAANIELIDMGKNESTRVYINEERARIWDDYLFIGGFQASSQIRFVRIFDSGKFKEGILKIKVLEKV